jgi:hypothetical protein
LLPGNANAPIVDVVGIGAVDAAAPTVGTGDGVASVVAEDVSVTMSSEGGGNVPTAGSVVAIDVAVASDATAPSLTSFAAVVADVAVVPADDVRPIIVFFAATFEGVLPNVCVFVPLPRLVGLPAPRCILRPLPVVVDDDAAAAAAAASDLAFSAASAASSFNIRCYIHIINEKYK